MKIKKLLNRWTTGVLTAVIITAGSLALASLATEEQSDTPPIVTTMPETTSEQKEKIYYEYYTITEEAVKNGWTCHTIDRCDKNKIMVYIYDPALIGQHKFNIVTYFNFVEADLTFVFVDKYNNILEERTTTYKAGDSYRGIAIVIDDYPPGTKYVKFKDMTNIVYFYPSKKDS